ncbi:MAG: altronate dehydratase family protein [Opitutaceae bacterium]
MSSSVLHIHPRDNVAVALAALPAGQTVAVAGRSVTLAAAIPTGHKFALTALPAGTHILKFGQPIGHATEAIPAGGWVHTHNVKTNLSGVLEYSYQPAIEQLAPIADGLTFDGYHRSDGEVGIRNELWILPTVGCVNEVSQAIRRRLLENELPEGVDGVHVYTHPYGCSQLGGDHTNTQKILADLARHPNAAGVLVVGLGCENNTMASFRQVLGDADPARYRFLVAQEQSDEIAAGVALGQELIAYAAKARRQPTPVARLRVGLKCGGSDGFSGITANPLVGAFSDLLVARGGTSVLTEVPEMFGAEALFMNRCRTRQVFDECVAMINGFKEYFLRYNQVVYENPSPGNKDGGITTLEEKSLGCLQKGGTSEVVDILPYAARLKQPGLNFLTGPGNDIVSCTAMAAAGAHLILFTTGRGTPLGAPVPTLKIATNSDLATRKAGWIDFNAGRLLEGATMADTANALLRHVLAVASGAVQAKNEINGFREIAIFKDGVTL